ncbi:hypothetical protein OG232_18630 [Streptomyces sp. NBC_01411]|uniref:hypothetical protein n=1 Tax=Streptomyces sp. NBC_01411 TaxID=2903857 RepID=UPI003250D102
MSTPAAPAAGPGDIASATTESSTGQDPTAAPTAPATPAAPAVPVGEDVSSLPPWAQQQLTSARAEAAKSRTIAKANAAQEAEAVITQRLAEAFGIAPTPDAPPDPPRSLPRLPSSPRSCAPPRFRTPPGPPRPSSRPAPIGS